MKYYKGYTLVELLVVMSIIAVLSSLGIAGMTTFRNAIEVQNASFELASLLQTYENKSRNSVPSTAKTGSNVLDKRVDGYAIFFTGSNYDIRYCMKVGTSWDCTGVEVRNAKLSEYSEVTVTPIAADASRCRGILFERLTAKISRLTNSRSPAYSTGTCTIELVHGTTGTTVEMIFDLDENDYYLD